MKQTQEGSLVHSKLLPSKFLTICDMLHLLYKNSTKPVYASCSGYMSPEYAMGGLFSEKSDVFSLGVILLEIVSGRRNSNSTLLAYVSLS